MKKYRFTKLTYYLSLWLTVVVVMLVTGASQAQAHQTSSNGCYHPTNQWVSCCGANYCSSGNLVNDCLLYYYTGSSGYPTTDANHSSESSWTESHEVSSPDCPPPTICTPNPSICNDSNDQPLNPACDQTLYGVDNCNKTCSRSGSLCPTPIPRVSIGGRITNSVTRTAIPGVIVNQGITSPRVCNIGTAVTDTAGDYRFNNVSQGLSFCLRPPTLVGYTGPVNSVGNAAYENQEVGTVDKTDYNFTYTSANFIIGGNIKDGSNNLGIPGVIVNNGITTPPLCKIGRATSAANGDYRFGNVSANLDFCLRPPAVTGYLGPSPASFESATATADHTTYNFTYTPKITLSCTNATVNQGSSANSTVTINRAAVTLTQSVSISATAFPATGISFNSPACAPDCTTALTITAGSTAATGAHTITVTGTTADVSGTFSRSNTCTLTVNAVAPTRDFSLANSGNCTATQGGSNSSCSTITVSPVLGFSSTVNLTVAAPTDGTPSRNGTASISPTSLASTAFATGAALNVTNAGTCAIYPCQKTITITGTGGTPTLTRTTRVTLTVNAPGVVPPPPAVSGTSFVIKPFSDNGYGSGIFGNGIKDGAEQCLLGEYIISVECISPTGCPTPSSFNKTFLLVDNCQLPFFFRFYPTGTGDYDPAIANLPSGTSWRITLITWYNFTFGYAGGTTWIANVDRTVNVLEGYEPTRTISREITIP